MITQNQSMVKNQDFVIWIQIVSLYTQNQMIFITTLQKMLIQGLILQIMNWTSHCLKKNRMQV